VKNSIESLETPNIDNSQDTEHNSQDTEQEGIIESLTPYSDYKSKKREVNLWVQVTTQLSPRERTQKMGKADTRTRN